MLSRRDLEPLLKYVSSKSSPVLSLYLDVDLARPANRNRGILVAARALLAALREESDSGPQTAELDGDARRAEAFLADYAPSGKSLALFCDASEDFLWHHTLPVHLQPDARYRPDPHVRPLLEMLEEQERYGIVLLDRRKARLYSAVLGEIEEHSEAFAPLDVSSRRTTGTDHLFSEKRFQRRAHEHAHLHLKHVASMLRRLQHEIAFDRLVISGPVEATSELHRILPRALADRVVATWKLPIETKAPDLLREVVALQERRDSERQFTLIEDLIAAAGNGHQAVVGLEQTLEALRGGRVLRLVYVADEPVEGGICRKCRSLSRRASGECNFCRAPLDRVRDLVGRMARLVADSGGALDRLHGPAASRLRAAGDPGAFLRF
jgi:peptide chain release factor subunit 1